MGRSRGPLLILAVLSLLCAPRALAAAEGGVTVYTGQRGMYRVTGADLSALGVPIGTIDPQKLALWAGSAEVAISVTGDGDGRFDLDDRVVFYAEPYAGRYTREKAYRLSWLGPPGRRIAGRSALPSSSAPRLRTVRRTLHLENDRIYYSTYRLSSHVDHFFEEPLYPFGAAPVAASTRVFTPTAPLRDGQIRLTARFHGGASRANFNPDQAVSLRVNNWPAGTFTWDGSQVYTATATLPATALVAGPNVLTLEARLDQIPGIDAFWVSPDWIEISYPGAARAESDELFVPPAVSPGAAGVHLLYLPVILVAGGPSATGAMVISGFSEPPVVFDVSEGAAPVQLAGSTVSEGSGFTTSFEYESGRAYFAATAAALRPPARLAIDAPSSWRSPDNAADYIAIVHRLLWDAIDPLLEQRSAEGFRVAKVDVQDIYDEFGRGLVDPEAIRAFVTYAYHQWNAAGPRPAYVLLVGDGHYDFRGDVAPELPNLIPPYLLHVDPFIGETAADNRYACVDGPSDLLPDLAIGRIPARNPQEVTAYVDKLLAYERSEGGDWQRRLVFAADSAGDPSANFHWLSDQARAEVPAGYGTAQVYFGSSAELDSAAEMREALRSSFDQGALYLQWFGHASRQRWGSGLSNMFDLADVSLLAASSAVPLTAHYSCWSGYFINPRGSMEYGNNEQSLGEALLLAPGRGSLADFSSTGLHVGYAALRLDQELLRALLVDRVERVGKAVMHAKRAFYEAGAGPSDLIDTQILFGDPALRLRLPVP